MWVGFKLILVFFYILKYCVRGLGKEEIIMLFFNLLVKFGWFKVIYLVFMFRCYIDIMIEVYWFVGMD